MSRPSKKPIYITFDAAFADRSDVQPVHHDVPLGARPDTSRWMIDTWPRKWLEVYLRVQTVPRQSRARVRVSVDPPVLALRLFSRQDAAHYAREWRAHLSELVAEGEYRQARRDRRRLAMRAPCLALELRVRALLRRRLRSPR